MSGIDPLAGNIEQLQTALARPVTAVSAEAAIDVGPDGGLLAIRITDHGRRLDPDSLAEVIVRLHASALTEARRAIADAVARLEADPRLRARREQLTDALQQPPSRRAATREEDDETDRYYQRQSWLE
ncbi:hypothetical protein [Nocardia pseudobrasiliensis]|uniref:YbaB/EbfC DNA-binding family protein n=1 Tax=Nocardia pseudobrasiliensis TaxID=45979 RepID=A0A370IBC0_9NOCA|nr:hypothetical protein [Nocardia pseudobrasiliensis]RDI68022.1 hypothetical protein DFR76_102423 [Nocardia pseudobrasiliensis]